MKETKKEGSRLFTVINILLCIILIPVILINAAVIVSSYIHPDEIPGIFGIKPVAVLSGSMESTFMAGDLIFVKKTSTDSLKEGDVICYLVSDQAVTHRISAIQQDEDGSDIYITKGDANNTEDQDTVKPEQVQGVWTGGRLGGMGNFVMFLSSTTGMIVFIFCPILLLIVWDIIRRWKTDKKEKARAAQLEAELNAMRALQNGQKDTAENQDMASK